MGKLKDWKKTATGYTAVGIDAELSKKGKQWYLTYNGQRYKMPRRAGFGHAEGLIKTIDAGNPLPHGVTTENTMTISERMKPLLGEDHLVEMKDGRYAVEADKDAGYILLHKLPKKIQVRVAKAIKTRSLSVSSGVSGMRIDF